MNISQSKCAMSVSGRTIGYLFSSRRNSGLIPISFAVCLFLIYFIINWNNIWVKKLPSISSCICSSIIYSARTSSHQPVPNPISPYLIIISPYLIPSARTSSHEPVPHPISSYLIITSPCLIITSPYLIPSARTSSHQPVPHPISPYLIPSARTSSHQPIPHPISPYLIIISPYLIPSARTLSHLPYLISFVQV